jgi:hypothetical protein
MSDEQQRQLMQLEQKLPDLKEQYRRSMEVLLTFYQKRSKIEEKRAAFWACHNAGVAFFNAHEKVICDGALLKADLNPTWYTDRAETAANVLETVCLHYETLYEKAPDVKVDVKHLKPSMTAFAGMQRIVKQNLSQLAGPLRDHFVRAGLPTHGFDTDESVKSSHTIEPRFFAVGVVCFLFGLAMVVWAFQLGNLTKDQRFLLQWLLPLVGAFMSASFTGSISATGNRLKYGIIVAATGGFAVWCLTYLMLRCALPMD